MIKHRKRTWLLVIGLLLSAAFLLGMGLAQMLSFAQQPQQPLSVVDDPAAGVELEDMLAKVHADTEPKAKTDGRCEMRIENYSDSGSCVCVRLVRIATGEVLYQSGVIDPGYSEYEAAHGLVYLPFDMGILRPANTYLARSGRAKCCAGRAIRE